MAKKKSDSTSKRSHVIDENGQILFHEDKKETLLYNISTVRNTNRKQRYGKDKVWENKTWMSESKEKRKRIHNRNEDQSKKENINNVVMEMR